MNTYFVFWEKHETNGKPSNLEGRSLQASEVSACNGELNFWREAGSMAKDNLVFSVPLANLVDFHAVKPVEVNKTKEEIPKIDCEFVEWIAKEEVPKETHPHIAGGVKVNYRDGSSEKIEAVSLLVNSERNQLSFVKGAKRYPHVYSIGLGSVLSIDLSNYEEVGE